MVLLAPHGDGDWVVLVIRRPSTMSEHADQLALPGGRFDGRRDRSLWDTAQRETAEEVGIHVPRQWARGFLAAVFIPVTAYTILPVVAAAPRRPPVVPGKEVAKWAWVPLGALRQARRDVPWRLDPNRLVPEFPLLWGTIWGATGRVLAALLDIMGGGEDAH